MPNGALKRILFVDDEPKFLQVMQHLLQRFENRWHMEFLDGTEKALISLAQRPFDAVVTDLTMPDPDGLQLLQAVSQQFPQCVRIVLSGNLDEEQTQRLADLPHHCVLKPCKPNELGEMIDRACVLQDLLTDPQLKGLITQIRSLPSLPSLYNELLGELRKDEPSLDRVGEIVARDLGMSSKMLHLINSAFFGLPREVTTPGEAVMFLGVETIKALALSLQVFSQFKTVSVLSAEVLWNHSWTTGVMAKRIATDCGAPKMVVDQSFIAGLMHDVGKLVLESSVHPQFQRALALASEKEVPLWQAECEIFGASHAEVGAYLLGRWALPRAVVEALAFHHRPNDCVSSRFTPLTAVHIADALQREQSGMPRGTADAVLDATYVERLALTDRLDFWREGQAEAA